LFDTLWVLKAVAHITYTVLAETLNHAHSINLGFTVSEN